MAKVVVIRGFIFFFISFIFAFAIIISIPRSDLDVYDQPVGMAIHIPNMSIQKGGFVVVMATDPKTNLPDDTKVMNNPMYLPAGKYENMDVLLKDETPPTPGYIVVTLYEDRGTDPGYFEVDPTQGENTDVPLVNFDGKIVRKIIKLY